MYGTVTPWSVVVVAIDAAGGGAAVVRLERVRGGVHVLEREERSAVALRVRRHREAGDRLADPRLHLRAGEDRAAARMVRDGEMDGRAVAHRRHQVVRAVRETGDDALVERHQGERRKPT